MQQDKFSKKRWLTSAIKAAETKPVVMPWQRRRHQTSSIARATPAQPRSEVARA